MFIVIVINIHLGIFLGGVSYFIWCLFLTLCSEFLTVLRDSRVDCIQGKWLHLYTISLNFSLKEIVLFLNFSK